MSGEVTLVFATYINGMLTSIELRKTSDDSETFNVTGSPDNVKVFVIEDTDNLIPVTDAETVSLQH